MTIKLNLKQSLIPVQIGELKFQVDLSDTHSKNLETKLTNFLREVNQLDLNDTSEEKFKTLLHSILNELLGDGAFEKLYEYTKRTDLLAELLEELVIELVKKLPGRDSLLSNKTISAE